MHQRFSLRSALMRVYQASGLQSQAAHSLDTQAHLNGQPPKTVM
jgi:hypothetical protein